jgi:hypothetical protein
MTTRKPPRKPRKDSYSLKALEPSHESVYADARLMLSVRDVAER